MQEQAVNSLVPFSFKGMALKESCWIEGVPYFTSRAIGEFLGYINPIKAISNLVNRNSYIFEYRTILKLRTVEGGEINLLN